MFTKFLPPPKKELEVKPVQDFYSDEKKLTKKDVPIKPNWNEVSPLWHFILGDESIILYSKRFWELSTNSTWRMTQKST